MPSDSGHRVSWEQALACRMRRHRLVERAAPADLVIVVSGICRLHAQLLSSTNRGMTGHPEIDVLTEAVRRALEGRFLTREELALAVEEVTGEATFGDYVCFSWGAGRAEIASAEPRDVARLLPAFDPWVVGASRRAPALLEPRHRARV